MQLKQWVKDDFEAVFEKFESTASPPKMGRNLRVGEILESIGVSRQSIRQLGKTTSYITLERISQANRFN